MKVKIVGKKLINYTNKQGRKITGVEIHCIYNDNRVEGNAVEKFYIPSAIPNWDKLDNKQEVNILFNQYGKVDFLVLE